MDKRKMTIKIYTKLHRKLKFEQNITVLLASDYWFAGFILLVWWLQITGLLASNFSYYNSKLLCTYKTITIHMLGTNY
jgi:hypothetical protein